MKLRILLAPAELALPDVVSVVCYSSALWNSLPGYYSKAPDCHAGQNVSPGSNDRHNDLIYHVLPGQLAPKLRPYGGTEMCM